MVSSTLQDRLNKQASDVGEVSQLPEPTNLQSFNCNSKQSLPQRLGFEHPQIKTTFRDIIPNESILTNERAFPFSGGCLSFKFSKVFKINLLSDPNSTQSQFAVCKFFVSTF